MTILYKDAKVELLKFVEMMKCLLVLRAVAVSCLAFGILPHANAQFGNVLNRVGQSAKSSVERTATSAVESAGKKALKSAKDSYKKSKKDKEDAQSWTYGDHAFTMKGNLNIEKYKKDAYGEVTFTNVPSDYDEFESVYYEFLGRTPYGAAAMMPMAMEMYARDREVGKKCIELLCYQTNVNSVIPRLRDKFGSQPDDSYGQRYLPAAVLKGAKASNAYTPDRPYTVEMEASVNKHQQMEITGNGTVMYIYIIGGGWDAQQRQVEVILEPGKEHYQVFNCPSLYTGCRQIQGQWKGLD